MKRLEQRFARLSNRQILGFVVLLALLPSLLSLFLSVEDAKNWWSGILQNFSTEMLGAFITFWLFDEVLKGREEYKRRMIKRFRSPHPEIAGQALHALKEHGWLYDGSLQGAYLSFANWSGLDLSGADLEGARLRKVKLTETDLRNSNLKGTNVSVERLAKAKALKGAIMPDGRRYDGRLRLTGDLKAAKESDVALDNPAMMADFYGVSVDDFRQGQDWADKTLASIRAKSSSFFEKPWWERVTE